MIKVIKKNSASIKYNKSIAEAELDIQKSRVYRGDLKYLLKKFT